ncbi:MAG: hypothetical protein OEY97_05920 [Nitrospirota bacterium]|nr:hypothetical protein [Nitrospirota bacterium]
MKSYPTVRQTSYQALALVLFNCLLLGGMAGLAGAVLYAYAKVVHGIYNPLVMAVPWVLFLILPLGLPQLAARGHRRGAGRLKREQFTEAIGEFQSAYDFFSRHPWLDRYRALILFNASAFSYREAALISIAYCHARMGNVAGYRAYLERALAEFPDSQMAKNSLNMLDALEANLKNG